tara:strand:+ start:141 stop:1097 length:957 start_codon:yes stop_codon:yes gene_type:complete
MSTGTTKTMNEPDFSSSNLYADASGKGAMVNKPVAAPGTAEQNKATLAPKPSDASPEIQTISVREHLENLFDGEELSEEFMEKAETVFETAINERVQSLEEEIAAKIQEEHEKELETFKEELVERIDDYLNYVVEEWVKENELAIENGLRTEVAESFINGLKSLFETNYIDIPDEKVDVLEELVSENETTTEQLNTIIAENIELAKQVEMYRKAELFANQAENLTDVEIDKFASLAESIDYTGDEDYQKKLVTIRESYFNTNTTQPETTEILTESGYEEDLVEMGGDEVGAVSSPMDLYVNALDRQANQRKIYENNKG